MKARSEALRDQTSEDSRKPEPDTAPTKRLPQAERRVQILRTAADFFADYGLTAQTRRLAEACGISQRLLYRYFPTKEDLLAAVYRQEILGAFKMVWFVELQDRSKPVEERLTLFYRDYLDHVLNRKWLRLFLYASLADAEMAPDYISSVIKEMLEVIVQETAAEKGVTLPDDISAMHEMGWTLHGSISHYAIRRHLYRSSSILPEEKVVAMSVRTFLAGFEPMVQDYLDHLD